MTVHSAKGLEFGAVFLFGVEDGIFPGDRSLGDPKEMEEERRLMYVAITRAKKNLFMVLARQRMIFGQTRCMPPSRFLLEIDESHIYKMGNARSIARRPDETTAPPARAEARKAVAGAMASSVAKKKTNIRPSGMDPSEISVGLKVKHDRFGGGVIIKVEPVAGDALVTVDFDGMKKNMLVRTSGLKKA